MSEYTATETGGEVETTTDTIRGTRTVTTKDVSRRVVRRTVTGIGATAAGAETTTLSDELYGYNAEGRLAYTARQQSGVPAQPSDATHPEVRPGYVVSLTHYDELGRPTITEMSGAAVMGQSGDATTTWLKVGSKYQLGSSPAIVDFDPFTSAETSAPRTVRKLDSLGRTTVAERQSAAGVPAASIITKYDINGLPVFVTDGVRNAAITRNDPFGRATGTLAGDGTSSEVDYNEWDEATETRSYERTSGGVRKLASRQRNAISPAGRLQRVVSEIEENGLARATQYVWADGDSTNAARTGAVANRNSDFADAAITRAKVVRYDLAGRAVQEIAGEARGLNPLPESTNREEWTRVERTFRGELPELSEVNELRSGTKTSSTSFFDGLGRVLSTTDADTYTSLAVFDEAGNGVMSQAPGMGPELSTYDSRGLAQSAAHSDGAAVRFVYDQSGILRQRLDEEGQATIYDVDDVGRVAKVHYKDGTTEETRYELRTGLVEATRDRAKQWICFGYDAVNRVVLESDGGVADLPSCANPPKLVEYVYDNGGRLTFVKNADAAISYSDFDLLGRARTTRVMRYGKLANCQASADSCGAGFSGAAPTETYVQAHQWSVFDSERSRWRMPYRGDAIPLTEAETLWRSWIVEERDAAGNITKQSEALGALTAPSAAITEAIARSAGRLAQRTRWTTDGGIVTQFGYQDGTASPEDPVVPVFESVTGPATGELGRAATLQSTVRITGAQSRRDATRRLAETADLGLTERRSTWDYDDRGRLEESVLLRGATGGAEPRVQFSMRPADFLEKHESTPRVGAVVRQQLGASIFSVEPANWLATPKNGAHQIEKRTRTNGNATVEDAYDFTGGRRTLAGEWTYGYDKVGRMTSQESVALGRKLTFDFDPNDRIIGRTAWQLVGTDWQLETRTNVLARDGLPARTTFVWDPVVDRLVAVYDSAAAAQPGATDAQALLRQYVHGGESYDDPVEVLARTSTLDTNVSRYLPIVDEAATGSLQAIVRDDGSLAERVVYADPYGDAPRYIHGAFVQKIEARRYGSTRQISVELSDAIDATSIAEGARLVAVAADGSKSPIAGTPVADGANALLFTIDGARWSALSTSESSIDVELTPSLRFKGWGSTAVQTPAAWQLELGDLSSNAAAPVSKRVSLALLDSELGTSSSASAMTTVYATPDLYAIARVESKTQLNFDFHAYPFVEPSNGMVYARARWYDPSTGSFVTPDPMGYTDSSNMYAFAGGDPVNNSDPTGKCINPFDKRCREEMAWTAKDFGSNTLHDVWDAASLGTLSRVEQQTNLGTLRGLGESTFNGARSISNSASLGLQDEIYETQMREGPGVTSVAKGAFRAALNLTPYNEVKALITEDLSTEERVRLAFTGLSKTAALFAAGKGIQETVAFKRLPQVQQNNIVGNAARDALAVHLESSGEFAVLGEEVAVRIPAGKVTASGRLRYVTRKADLVVRNELTGEVGGLEVKTGNAMRDDWQFRADRWINTFGARTTGVKSTGIVPRINTMTTVFWPAPRFTFFQEIYTSLILNGRR